MNPSTQVQRVCPDLRDRSVGFRRRGVRCFVAIWMPRSVKRVPLEELDQFNAAGTSAEVTGGHQIRNSLSAEGVKMSLAFTQNPPPERLD